MESLLFAIHLLLPCQVECVCNVCSSIVFKNLWIITNYVEVWQITAICAVNETHSDGLRILGFLEKREEKYICFFFHSDWGLLLKRNVPPVHLSTYANIPSGTNITWMCWFSNKNAIWSCRKFQFICKKKKIQLIFVVVAKFHIIPMEWFNLEYIQYTMMYALASTATTSVSWLQ